MEEKYTWNLTDIFKTKEEFEKEIEKLNKMLNEIKTYQGKLFNSSENIYQCYRNYEKALEYYEKIYAYGMLKFHLDMANSENIKLFKRCEGIGTEFEMTTSFITPEITDIDTDLLLKYLDENNELKRYERLIKEIIENKPHILSKEEENILANYSEVFNSSKNAFEILTNTEFKFGIIELKDGKKVELTDSNYTEFMKNQDEDIRKKAFNMYREKYKEFCGTISELYLSKVRENVITARLRKYSSALEMEVFKDDSNLDVYNNLVEAVNQNLECKVRTVSDASDIAATVSALISDGCTAIYIPTDNLIAANMPAVTSVTDEKKIPTICGEAGCVLGGGTITYGVNYYALGKQTANQAIQILFNNVSPSNIPVGMQTSPEELDIVINEESVNKLGITIPDSIKKRMK